MTQQVLDILSREYPWLIAKMLWYQNKQGRPMTYSLELDSREYNKGFYWKETTEGVPFWSKVLNGKQIPKGFPEYGFGSSITVIHKGKPKEFKVMSWDLKNHAVWTMTAHAYELFMTREPSDDTRQDLRKMPITNIVWQ